MKWDELSDDEREFLIAIRLCLRKTVKVEIADEELYRYNVLLDQVWDLAELGLDTKIRGLTKEKTNEL